MTYTIQLTQEEQRRVQEAKRRGVDLGILVRALITALPNGGEGARSANWRDVTIPLQQDFATSGMTDEDLGALIDNEIAAYRRENATSEG